VTAGRAPTVDPLVDLARAVQAACVARELTVATAESCTGGLVSHLLTEVPGASAYFAGGVVSYSDRVKVDALGVPTLTIERYGAVSAQAARAMAVGARERLGTKVAVAVTGIAGPDGGSAGKPVGLTFIAVARARRTELERHVWHGSRDANKRSSAEAALRLLLRVVTAP